MTQKELENVFRKHGLEVIEPQEGEKFDYNAHHAITQIVTDKHKAGTIVNTMQVGYKIKDRLIRPASVAVAKNCLISEGASVSTLTFWSACSAFAWSALAIWT